MAERKDRSAYIGAGTGVAALAGMGIDRRVKHDPSKMKHLGHTWNEVKKHVRPGDVLIGADTTVGEAYKRDKIDFDKAYENITKGKKTYNPIKNIKNIVRAAKKSGVATTASKISHPQWSHSELMINKDQSAFGGGGVAGPGKYIPENKGELRRKIKSGGGGHHFIVMRPNTGVSPLSGVTSKNEFAVRTEVLKRAGGKSKYRGSQGTVAQIKDWITPKFRRKEVAKTVKTLASDVNCPGGVCSTLPAKYSKRTVGGKQTKNVLPKDFLRSSDYSPVGTIGKIERKIPFKQKLITNIPKSIVRGGLAGAIGLGAYGAAKLYHKFTGGQKKTASIQEIAFKEELEKIALVSHGIRSVSRPGANFFMKSSKSLSQYKPNMKPAPKLKTAQRVPTTKGVSLS